MGISLHVLYTCIAFHASWRCILNVPCFNLSSSSARCFYVRGTPKSPVNLQRWVSGCYLVLASCRGILFNSFLHRASHRHIHEFLRTVEGRTLNGDVAFSIALSKVLMPVIYVEYRGSRTFHSWCLDSPRLAKTGGKSLNDVHGDHDGDDDNDDDEDHHHHHHHHHHHRRRRRRRRRRRSRRRCHRRRRCRHHHHHHHLNESSWRSWSGLGSGSRRRYEQERWPPWFFLKVIKWRLSFSLFAHSAV